MAEHQEYYTGVQVPIMQITSISTASISFTASSAIAIMVLMRSEGALSTPYRRLILGLSLSDIFQSAALMTGPVMIPAYASPPNGPPVSSILSMGNTASCTVNGFFFSIGWAGVAMYTASLCIYYLCRINLGMEHEEFAKLERAFHIVIIGFNIIGSMVGLFTNSFNALLYGIVCHYAGYPLNCDVDPEVYGECIRGNNAFRYTILFFHVPVFLSFIIITVSMILMCLYATQQKFYTTSQTTTDDLPAEIRCKPSIFCAPCCICKHGASIPDDLQQRLGETTSEFVDRLQRLFVRETMAQGRLYIGVFFLVYVGPIGLSIIHLQSNSKPSFVFFNLAVALYPLGGFFNILVYSRPKVRHLMRRNSDISFLHAVCIVIRAGGDLPDESTFRQASRQVEDVSCCRRLFVSRPTVSSLTGLSGLDERHRMRRRGGI